MNTHKEPIINYTTHCPQCDSEEIEMIGDREYNDEWHCEDCDAEFGTFVQKEHIVELAPLEPKEEKKRTWADDLLDGAYDVPTDEVYKELDKIRKKKPTPPSQIEEESQTQRSLREMYELGKEHGRTLALKDMEIEKLMDEVGLSGCRNKADHQGHGNIWWDGHDTAKREVNNTK